jgi:hypothetical protein
VAYLEARLLEAGGKLREAAAKFAESAERMSSGSGVNEVQPLAGMARCLLALKDAQAAERVLANFLERGIPEAGVSRAVWDLWLGAAAARSRDGQRSILESFPKVAATNAEPGGEIREALLDLETAGAFRLNCGGGEYRSQDGRLWRSDRFFTSGYRHHGDAYGIAITPFVEDVAGTEDDGLYQTNRWFLTEQEGPGAYRIPVSAGRYRVRLHFAEILPRAPQWRLFDLELEGKVVLSEYDPGAAGFAVAQSRAYEVEVEDGFIDLVFVSRRGHPFVSAIEVEAIR